MREFVHDPMKTVSTATSCMGVPATSPMYSSARAAASRSAGSAKLDGVRDGARRSGRPGAGFVPHVTWGRIADASMVTDLSNSAPSSVTRPRQSSSARSHIAPVGAWGRPSRYANVVSSGAIIPARAPASMDMLHIVIRPSIDSARMAGPRYSITWPMPPLVPMRPMMASTMSLAVTPGGRVASTSTAMLARRIWGRVWVASTCSTSDVPMPNASAPKAPWVEVWLSPHTIVMPGCDSPSSGPMMWTMPWFALPIG